MVSIEYSEAIVEVLDILQYSDDNIIEKIPKEIIEFWQKNKSITYRPKLDHSKTINEMHLKNKTKSIITMIYLNYLCDDVEKNDINLILKANEEKYQEELIKTYNPDNIFKKHKKVQKIDENIVANKVTMMAYKESILTRFINKIKNILHFE